MNKDKKKERKQDKSGKREPNFKEEYSYDFIPTLNEWVNIDEQKEKVKELEDI